MTSNAQCERCGGYAIPAYSSERICEECHLKGTPRHVRRWAIFLMDRGVALSACIQTNPAPIELDMLDGPARLRAPLSRTDAARTLRRWRSSGLRVRRV